MSDKPRTLSEHRSAIDAIDDRILELLCERAGHNAEIGGLKVSSSASVWVPARELDIIERLERQNRGPFPTAAIRSVFREIISASRSLQRAVTVAYLGPQGTYTHEAALRQFGQMAQFVPAATIDEIFHCVETDRCEYGVVPVENSSEGVVSHTLDLMADSPLTISAEIHVPIHHDLLARTGSLRDITAVYSHPQGLAQCRKWLSLNLPDVPQYSTHSTAQAAERVSRELGGAAVASPVAAELYGLQVLQSGIEDAPDNTTRFLVLSRSAAQPSARDITSLLFSTRRDEVGTLYRALEPFARNGVNLTRIESRPIKERAWEYLFFCDFEGNTSEPAVARAVAELRGRCDFLKVLGSYPRAENR